MMAITSTLASSITSCSDGFADFLLAEFQCAAIRARLLATEIESAAVALRGGFVDVDTAMEWMGDIGALGLIAPSSATTPAST